MATPATWQEIVPTDSVDRIGATASAELLEPLVPLEHSNPQTPNSTTLCKSWVLAAPLLEMPHLLASKPAVTVTTVEQPSPGSVDLQEDPLPGSKGVVAAVAVVANAMLPPRADLHHGRQVVLEEVAQLTATEVATVVVRLQAQLHGSNSSSPQQHPRLDMEAGMEATAGMVTAERQATSRATDRQLHRAWHHGSNRLMAQQAARLLLLLVMHLLLHLRLRRTPLPLLLQATKR